MNTETREINVITLAGWIFLLVAFLRSLAWLDKMTESPVGTMFVAIVGLSAWIVGSWWSTRK